MHEIKQGDHMFYIGDDATNAIAYIRYKDENENTIVANSTYVDPSLRGQQIAKKLLDRLADFARENSLKIRPTCSYVVTMFERDKSYNDIAV